MSFWTLQEHDMQKPAYLVPQMLKFTQSKTSWADVIKFKRRTHIAMLVSSASLGSLVTLSGVFVIFISYAIAVRSSAPHHVGIGIAYACIGLFLLYAATRITQSCVQLLRFLHQKPQTPAE
jgi:hypothetical protein